MHKSNYSNSYVGGHRKQANPLALLRAAIGAAGRAGKGAVRVAGDVARRAGPSARAMGNSGMNAARTIGAAARNAAPKAIAAGRKVAPYAVPAITGGAGAYGLSQAFGGGGSAAPAADEAGMPPGDLMDYLGAGAGGLGGLALGSALDLPWWVTGLLGAGGGVGGHYLQQSMNKTSSSSSYPDGHCKQAVSAAAVARLLLGSGKGVARVAGRAGKSAVKAVRGAWNKLPEGGKGFALGSGAGLLGGSIGSAAALSDRLPRTIKGVQNDVVTGASGLGGLALGKALGLPWWATGLLGTGAGIGGRYLHKEMSKDN